MVTELPQPFLCSNSLKWATAFRARAELISGLVSLPAAAPGTMTVTLPLNNELKFTDATDGAESTPKVSTVVNYSKTFWAVRSLEMPLSHGHCALLRYHALRMTPD